MNEHGFCSMPSPTWLTQVGLLQYIHHTHLSNGATVKLQHKSTIGQPQSLHQQSLVVCIFAVRVFLSIPLICISIRLVLFNLFRSCGYAHDPKVDIAFGTGNLVVLPVLDLTALGFLQSL